MSWFLKTEKFCNTSYVWKPKPDITTFELALCLKMLVGVNVSRIYDTLPDEAKRHWDKQIDEDGKPVN